MDLLESGTERPGVGEKWRGLPGRVRRTVGCGLTVVLLMTAGGYAYAQRSERPPKPQRDARTPPRPAEAVQLWSTGVGYLPPRSGDTSGTFALGFVANSSSTVTIERVRQTYGGLRVRLSGDRPVRVPGERRVTIDARVVSCRKLPVDARMPVVEFTVRNSRGRQTLRLTPGKRYVEALAATARSACAREGQDVPGTSDGRV